MKTFEQKWTAWLDGELTGKELSKFEASLPDKSAAEAEKHDALKLSALLKTHLQAPALTNAEFFGHQIRESIRRESAEQNEPRQRGSWWTVGRLAWVGATALVIFGVFTLLIVEEPDQPPSDYLTQITHTQVDPTANPYATTAVLEAKKDKVTVLWVEGLKSLPADYAAK